MMRFISSTRMAIFYMQPTIALLLGLSALIGVALGLSNNGEPPFNPFSHYADILPGHTAASIKAPSFTCDTTYISLSTYLRTCQSSPESKIFLLISVTLSGVNVIEHTAFTLPQNTLQVGNLISLWGRPEKIKLFGVTAHLFWPERCATAWAIMSKRYYNPWLPIWYVVFDCK